MTLLPRLLADGFAFPEGPRWHQDRLWFSDMHGGTVHRTDLDGTVEDVLRIDDHPSGLGFLPDGDLLVVGMERRQLLRYDGSRTTVHADLGGLARHELNDMVVDRHGRAYVGTLALPLGEGVLFRVDPDGSVSVAADGLDCPNGTVITEDGRTLVVAESKGRRHTAFDVGPDGGLSGRRTYAEHAEAAPDGLALDAEGALWVALPLAHAFIRLLPGTGVTERIEVGEQLPLACALGGPERRSLFLLMAPAIGAQALAGRREGRVEVVDVDVPGVGLP